MRGNIAGFASLLMACVMGMMGGTSNQVTTAHKSQSQGSSTEPDRREKFRAVNLVRVINTAEMRYRDSEGGGTFAELHTLVQTEVFKEATNHFQVTDLSLNTLSNIMTGWHLRLTVPPDKSSYVVALNSTSDKQCFYELVSDEEGVIREARAIGCPTCQ